MLYGRPLFYHFAKTPTKFFKFTTKTALSFACLKAENPNMQIIIYKTPQFFCPLLLKHTGENG